MGAGSGVFDAIIGKRIDLPSEMTARYLNASLLLHELRHVHQFLDDRTFPVRYLWQSIRYGYSRNAYEVDARRYSALRLNAADEEI